MPGDIVEPKIVCENENDVGLSVVLGPPLLLGEATVAEECHQEGDQHSSSQLILLNWKINFCWDDILWDIHFACQTWQISQKSNIRNSIIAWSDMACSKNFMDRNTLYAYCARYISIHAKRNCPRSSYWLGFQILLDLRPLPRQNFL